MITASLTTFWFLGFVYGSIRWLKIQPAYAPLFTISFIGIMLFIFGVSDMLQSGTQTLLILGGVLSVSGVFDYWKNKAYAIPKWMILGLAAMILGSFILTLGMKFTVDDDYVFWGILGKYLSYFHHLPNADTTIIKRHLAYPPGTSLMHYLVFQINGKYSPAMSYFSQNLFLISALFVVFSKKTFQNGFVLLCLLIVLMTVFAGSVFTKLQVDYLLSIYYLAVLWIILKEKPSIQILLTIITPVCFLFLIKQIGFLMGLVLLIVFLVELIFNTDFHKKEKLKTAAVFCLFVGVFFSLKQVWGAHCTSMGFDQFNSSMNMDSILGSLHIFSNESVQKGFFLYLREVLIGESDRLNLPYICWYLALSFFSFKSFAQYRDEDKKKRFRIATALLTALFVYLVMLYFLQIIVFKVGAEFDHTIGFSRYMNIFFAPMVWLASLLYVEQILDRRRSIPVKVLVSFGVVVTLILGISRIETTLRREKHYQAAQVLSGNILKHTTPGPANRLGIIPGTKDHNLWIRMLYHLLPAKVNQGRFPAGDFKTFSNEIKSYDYLLFGAPHEKTCRHGAVDPKILDWAGRIAGRAFDGPGFYRVEQTNYSETSMDKYGRDLDKPGAGIRLIKLFDFKECQ